MSSLGSGAPSTPTTPSATKTCVRDGFDVDGELSLHGVTRKVPLALVVNGFTRDPYGGTRAGFSATAEIDRKDFAITTNMPMDGGVVIGDTIQIYIETEAVLSPSEPAGA